MTSGKGREVTPAIARAGQISEVYDRRMSYGHQVQVEAFYSVAAEVRLGAARRGGEKRWRKRKV